MNVRHQSAALMLLNQETDKQHELAQLEGYGDKTNQGDGVQAIQKEL